MSVWSRDNNLYLYLATANCPSGWVKNPSNNICYGFFGSIHKYTIQMTSPLITPRTWTDANAHCQSMQAQLVSIHDNATNNFLISQTQQNNMGWYSFWTGLNDRNQEGGYSWFDGSSLQFTSWATQEPNDWRGGEDCVEVMLAQARAGWKFHWNDQSCTSKRPYVCAYPAGRLVVLKMLISLGEGEYPSDIGRVTCNYSQHSCACCVSIDFCKPAKCV